MYGDNLLILHVEMRNERRKRSKVHPLVKSLERGRMICLDAEFAAGSHMLELYISDCNGDTLYNHRFKPVGISRWRTDIHGISPEMVKRAPRFKKCRPRIQRIIDDAEYIMGFAIENDIRRLTAEGIVIPEDKKIIELRDWFWLYYGREAGLDLFNGISNKAVAQYLEVPLIEDRLHTSCYDTVVTMASFNRLLFHAAPEEGSMDELYERFTREYEVGRLEYERRLRAGFCVLTREEDKFRLRAVQVMPDDPGDVIATIKVESRKEALFDLGKMLAGRPMDGSFTFEKLSRQKLEKFKRYHNVYTPYAHRMARQLARLTKK